MSERIVKPSDAHRAFRNDVLVLLNKHAGHLDAKDMLALGAHLVGQLIALQDQRLMTTQLAMQIVERNIEVGNAEAMAEIQKPKGAA